MSNKLLRSLQPKPAKAPTFVFDPNNMITPEEVASASGLGLQKLLYWKKQETQEIEQRICKEYQKKLRRAEEYIETMCTFSLINTLFSLYKIKFNLSKLMETYEIEKAKCLHFGMIDAARRAQALCGAQIEYDDMDLNQEFHLGDWDSSANMKIAEMTPNQAYNYGWSESEKVTNVINTAVFVDAMIKKGMSTEEVGNIVVSANQKIHTFVEGSGEFEKFLYALRDDGGVHLGDAAFEIIHKYGL